MILYGPSSCLPYIDRDRFHVFNLTGLIETGDSLKILIPPNELGRTDSFEFDVNYYNYIMGNNKIFVTFFRIIQVLYSGKSVFIIYDINADWSEGLMESLLKIIQQRYGYNAYYVTTDNDIMEAIMSDDTHFDPGYGLANLDADKLRYQVLVKEMTLSIPDDKDRYKVEEFYSG